MHTKKNDNQKNEEKRNGQNIRKHGSPQLFTDYSGHCGTRCAVIFHAVMYPHKKDFLDTVKEYIDFSQNETLWKEMDRMSGLGMSVLLEGEARGEARGVTLGVTLSAQIFKIIQSGETDNNVIAGQCACSVAQVEEIRRAFGI